jgi:hypothetical protein
MPLFKYGFWSGDHEHDKNFAGVSKACALRARAHK